MAVWAAERAMNGFSSDQVWGTRFLLAIPLLVRENLEYDAACVYFIIRCGEECSAFVHTSHMNPLTSVMTARGENACCARCAGGGSGGGGGRGRGVDLEYGVKRSILGPSTIVRAAQHIKTTRPMRLPTIAYDCLRLPTSTSTECKHLKQALLSWGQLARLNPRADFQIVCWPQSTT